MAILESLDLQNSENLKDLAEWINKIIDAVGSVNLAAIMRKYREWGWISKEVEETVNNFAMGLKYRDGKRKEPKLTPDEHIDSLRYILKLAGKYNELTFEKYLEELENIINQG